MPQKTTILTPSQAAQGRRWHHLDAKGQVLGRLATKASMLLRGRHKSAYTDFTDCGDYVVVTNAAAVKFTGNKLNQKFYFSHSGYAGGAKTVLLSHQMAKDPRKVVYLAVKRMLPGNRQRSKQLTRLRIYVGDKHPHGRFTAPAGAAQ